MTKLAKLGMCSLVARIFPEQSHDAVLFWDCSVLSKLLETKVVSSTILSGHSHLLSFESERDSTYVLKNFHNMPVGDGIHLQLEGSSFKTAEPKASVSHPPPQANLQESIHGSAVNSSSRYVFWLQGFDRRTQLVVELADALNLHVDSLVYPTDELFTFDGGLAERIAQCAGSNFVNEVRSMVQRSNPKPTIGDAIITRSGLLVNTTRITTIVHALIPHYKHRDAAALMEKAVCTALRRADEQGAQSIGITVMGSGRFEWPVDSAAVTIVGSILTCLRQGLLCNVHEVHIFDRDEAKIAAVLRRIYADRSADLVPAAAHPPAAVRAAPPTLRMPPPSVQTGSPVRRAALP